MKFADSHLHLLALARALTEPDLGPPACRTIADVMEAAARSVDRPRVSGWCVLRGFDDALVREGRLLRRSELDAISPGPVRIRHRTGHASLLNSAAFDRLPAPPLHARVEPDDTGSPVLLIGAEKWLNECVGSPDRDEILDGLKAAGRLLASVGIEKVWDATPRTATDLIELRRLLSDARFPLQTRTMRSAKDLQTSARVIGETVKLFPEHHGSAFCSVVEAIHERGASVAIHATTEPELENVLAALERSRSHHGRDRIEHATLVSPAQARRIASVGATVVTHPGWLGSRRDKYQRQLSSTERARLLPFRTLVECGVEVVFSSDAPVELPDPVRWLDIATSREDGQAIPTTAALSAARGGSLWDNPSVDAASQAGAGSTGRFPYSATNCP